jgi:hypothetical protein
LKIDQRESEKSDREPEIFASEILPAEKHEGATRAKKPGFVAGLTPVVYENVFDGYLSPPCGGSGER